MQENKINHQDVDMDSALGVYCKQQGGKQKGGDQQHGKAPAFLL